MGKYIEELRDVIRRVHGAEATHVQKRASEGVECQLLGRWARNKESPKANAVICAGPWGMVPTVGLSLVLLLVWVLLAVESGEHQPAASRRGLWRIPHGIALPTTGP